MPTMPQMMPNVTATARLPKPSDSDTVEYSG